MWLPRCMIRRRVHSPTTIRDGVTINLIRKSHRPSDALNLWLASPAYSNRTVTNYMYDRLVYTRMMLLNYRGVHLGHAVIDDSNREVGIIFIYIWKKIMIIFLLTHKLISIIKTLPWWFIFGTVSKTTRRPISTGRSHHIRPHFGSCQQNIQSQEKMLLILFNFLVLGIIW